MPMWAQMYMVFSTALIGSVIGSLLEQVFHPFETLIAALLS